MLKLALWTSSLLLFAVFDASAASPALFWASRDYAILSPSAVVMADFDGDSKPDIAVANLYNQSVTILLSSGGVQVVTVGQNPVALAVADLNRDSKSDLVAATYASNNVSI